MADPQLTGPESPPTLGTRPCHGHSGAVTADRLTPAAARSIYHLYRRVGLDTGLFTPRRWTARRELTPILQAERHGITFHRFLKAQPA